VALPVLIKVSSLELVYMGSWSTSCWVNKFKKLMSFENSAISTGVASTDVRFAVVSSSFWMADCGSYGGVVVFLWSKE